MKKIVFVMVGALLVLSMLPLTVYAQEPIDPTITTQQTDSEEEPSSDDSVTKREERLARYKEKLEERLSAAEERKIRNSCKAAQVITGKLAQNADTVRAVRERAYTQVNEKLTNLVEKLQAASVDTTELEAAIESMAEITEEFFAAMEEYQTAIDDLSAMDCEENPEEFKAALEEAKRLRVTVISSSQSLRKYANETLKPILQSIRAELSGEEDGIDTTNTDDSNEQDATNNTDEATNNDTSNQTTTGGTQ